MNSHGIDDWSPPANLAELRAETRSTLSSLLGEHRTVALLDFPNHQNVGDSMIWRGELEHLHAIGVRVRYQSDLQRFSRELLLRAVPSGPILLHGGGNFGDLWPEFQRFRERIVRLFPGRPIIQLPQSIEFRDPEAAEAANRIFGQHGDFHLLVRDRQSHERARAMLPDVQSSFCHDAALGWEPRATAPEGAHERDILILARRDHERGTGITHFVQPVPGADALIADWGLHGIDAILWRLARSPLGMARAFPKLASARAYYPALRLSYAALAALNIRAGVRLFRTRRLIATDRLHAHVLALLLDKPHVVSDNSYGKIAGVMEASTGRLGEFLFVADEADVVTTTAWVRERLQQEPAPERGGR
ncbi:MULTISPECIES: polysaccharide pyruvyl transferase family protein [unclassified Curtobacterium]|uniref:polysaccharide pyruvyl transferase family protein n=1 Tax=unclassified Curtobacterium TaxID=257496 RepID=UPI0037FD4F42